MLTVIQHQFVNSGGNFNNNISTYHGQEWYPHFHNNFELTTVLSGTLKANIGDDSYDMQKGDWALILPNQVHAYTCDNDTVYWVMVFSEDYVPFFAEKVRGRQGDTALFYCDDAVLQMVKNHLMENKSTVLMKKACLYAVCDNYLSQIKLEARRYKSDFAVEKVLDYISVNFSDDISLKSCSAVLGYEYHYLSRLLEKTYNVNFRKLLNRYRTDAALELLRSTSLPVTDIALRCGFQSIRSFNGIIKNDVGMTPTAYRKASTRQ